MTPLPRRRCPVCGREVAVRVNGALREHIGRHQITCSGSGKKAAQR